MVCRSWLAFYKCLELGLWQSNVSPSTARKCDIRSVDGNRKWSSTLSTSGRISSSLTCGPWIWFAVHRWHSRSSSQLPCKSFVVCGTHLRPVPCGHKFASPKFKLLVKAPVHLLVSGSSLQIFNAKAQSSSTLACTTRTLNVVTFPILGLLSYFPWFWPIILRIPTTTTLTLETHKNGLKENKNLGKRYQMCCEPTTHHPSRSNTMYDIILNLPISLDYGLKILETFSCEYDLFLIFTSASALCVTSLNLHSRYSVLVLLNVKPLDSRVLLHTFY